MIVAIDGNSAAGKSTVAEALRAGYDCNLIRMDDFFDSHERFYEEVIVPLKKGAAFEYRRYDCSTGTLGEPVRVLPKRVNIIEGVYSMKFAEAYDLTVFMEVDSCEQLRRIKLRSPDKYERFVNEWIPAENRYFEKDNIKEKSCLSFRLRI